MRRKDATHQSASVTCRMTAGPMADNFTHPRVDQHAAPPRTKHHGRDDPPGATTAFIARQPARETQRQQRRTGDARHDQATGRIERRAKQQHGQRRGRHHQTDARKGFEPGRDDEQDFHGPTGCSAA
jgi:hypothetical protein